MRITLRCTLSQSVLSGHRCVQHDMLRTKGELTDSQQGADSEPWYNTIRVSCTSRQTGIARQPKQTSRKGEKQQRRRDAAASGKEQPRQRGSIDKLDYTSRFVRVIPTFSQHCHETVTLLNKSRYGRCKYGCCRMFISTLFQSHQTTCDRLCATLHLRGLCVPTLPGSH